MSFHAEGGGGGVGGGGGEGEEREREEEKRWRRRCKQKDTATYCNTLLQRVAACCSVLQCVARVGGANPWRRRRMCSPCCNTL